MRMCALLLLILVLFFSGLDPTTAKDPTTVKNLTDMATTPPQQPTDATTAALGTMMGMMQMIQDQNQALNT